MLGTLPDYTYAVASSPLLDLFEAAGAVPLPDTYEALERFIRADHSSNYSGIRSPRCVVAKRILRILGGRYVGRCAIWLYQEFLSSAQRVVSHPQGLVPTDPRPSPPLKAKSFEESEFPKMHNGPRQAEPCTSSQQAGFLRRLKTKTPSKPRQAVKRKSSSDSDHDSIFRCDKHNQVFTGEYAENSYKRHIRRTKGHGSPEFQCHLCPIEAFRVDH